MNPAKVYLLCSCLSIPVYCASAQVLLDFQKDSAALTRYVTRLPSKETRYDYFYALYWNNTVSRLKENDTLLIARFFSRRGMYSGQYTHFFTTHDRLSELPNSQDTVIVHGYRSTLMNAYQSRRKWSGGSIKLKYEIPLMIRYWNYDYNSPTFEMRSRYVGRSELLELERR